MTTVQEYLLIYQRHLIQLVIYILLTKLQHYGIRGVTLHWFKNYLTNRLQFVSIENVYSSNGYIRCGVPQGSILGPLLFLIFINDICYSSSVLKFILFAYDTKLFHSSKSKSELQHVLNHKMSALSEWFKANRLSLNIDKTSYILFCAGNARSIPQHPFELFIESFKVKRIESCKFLGVYLDDKMTWKTYIQQITSKMSKTIGIISRTKHILPKYTGCANKKQSPRKMLYFSHGSTDSFIHSFIRGGGWPLAVF